MANPQWPHRVASDTFYSLEQSRNTFRSLLMRKTPPLNEDHQDSGSICVLEKDIFDKCNLPYHPHARKSMSISQANTGMI